MLRNIHKSQMRNFPSYFFLSSLLSFPRGMHFAKILKCAILSLIAFFAHLLSDFTMFCKMKPYTFITLKRKHYVICKLTSVLEFYQNLCAVIYKNVCVAFFFCVCVCVSFNYLNIISFLGVATLLLKKSGILKSLFLELQS